MTTHWRVGLAALVMVGLTLAVGGRPAAAAGDVPIITVSAVGAQCDPEGTTSVSWTITQDTLYGGPVVSLQASPNSALHPNTNFLAGAAPIQVKQVIPRGSGATTATLTVAVEFGLPTGSRVITGAASKALPFCAQRVRGSAAFVMNCDRSVTATITYPGSAEVPAAFRVQGSSLSGGTWQSGWLTVQVGQVRAVVVPSPYTTNVTVTQQYAIPSQDQTVIGTSGQLNQPPSCPVVPPGAPPTGTQPGGSSTNAGGADPGASPVGSAPPGSEVSDLGPSIRAGQDHTRDETAVAASAPTALMPVAAVVGLSALGGLATVAMAAFGFLFLQRRRRASTPGD